MRECTARSDNYEKGYESGNPEEDRRVEAMRTCRTSVSHGDFSVAILKSEAARPPQ
jgi:hypothetical protein